MSKVRAIIPAAGLGSRMGMRPDESKEMLYDSMIGGPIIDYALNLCEQYDLDVQVITRREKKDLIEYLTIKGIDAKIIEPQGEWTNTVAQTNLAENNILILPDTRFNPTSIIEEIKRDLELGAEVSIGLHKVEDSSKWCIVQDYTLFEKQPNLKSKWAMGIMGFKYDEAFIDLEAFKDHILDRASFHYLTDFKDITRTGVIEEY